MDSNLLNKDISELTSILIKLLSEKYSTPIDKAKIYIENLKSKEEIVSEIEVLSLSEPL